MNDPSFVPKIIGFVCDGCETNDGDAAETSIIQYPSDIKIITVPCSGQVHPRLILNAFIEGADGVFVSGSLPGDCNSEEGKYHARRRLTLLKELLDHMGLDPERLQLYWVSATENNLLAELLSSFTKEISKMGPQTKFLGGGGEGK
jgi:F420-non-reducing hydrogenase iron-sulfur subunit